MPVTDALLIGYAALVSVPALMLGAECLLATLAPSRRREENAGARPPVAVVVPAHNEEAQIGATIRSIQPQLREADRLIVVADNCTDGTAAAAGSLGAEVLVRVNDTQRGKGYALRHAFEHLQTAPPAVVVCIDADCLATPGAIDLIAATADRRGCAVQAAYVMESPDDADRPASGQVSEFAVLVKNFVRPKGLGALGLPCLLTGSGMAFPWGLLQRVPHPESHIVEDMRYAVDMAIAGTPPRPCMDARVVSRLPARGAAVKTQRTRWEHGHLAMILSEAPRLAAAFLRSGRPSLLALLLEVSVPPLSLWVMLSMLTLVVTGVAAVLGASWIPLAIAASSATFATLGLGVSWFRYGREVLPARTLLAIPGYVLGKLPLYGKFARGREQAWVRTGRDSETPPVAAPHYVNGAPAARPVETDR